MKLNIFLDVSKKAKKLLDEAGYPDPEGKVTYSAKREMHCLISYNERLIDTGNA